MWATWAQTTPGSGQDSFSMAGTAQNTFPGAAQTAFHSWDTMQPGTSTASGAKAMDREELVHVVKTWQRKGDPHKASWYKWCMALGTTNHDPSRHEMGDLQRFVDGITSGEIQPEDGRLWENAVDNSKEKADLVRKVKGFQKRGEQEKGAWYEFLKSQGSSNRDPARHEAAVLRKFLSDYSHLVPSPEWNGEEEISGTGGKRGDWICSKCQNVNFSHRHVCNKCKTPNTGAERIGMKPGDWLCPNCGDLVFSFKAQCKMCNTPKPSEGIDALGLPMPGSAEAASLQMMQTNMANMMAMSMAAYPQPQDAAVTGGKGALSMPWEAFGISMAANSSQRASPY